MATTIDFNKPVKFSKPQSEFEKTATFMVTQYNESNGRVYVEHICDMLIKPQQLVSINDIENV